MTFINLARPQEDGLPIMKSKLIIMLPLILLACEGRENEEREYPTSDFDVTVEEERCSFKLKWKLEEDGSLHTEQQSDTSQTLYVTKWNKITVHAIGGASFEGCNCICSSDAVKIERLDDDSFSISWRKNAQEPVRIHLKAGEYSRSFSVFSREVIAMDWLLVDVDGKLWRVPGQAYKGIRYYKPYIDDPDDFTGTSSKRGDAMGSFVVEDRPYMWVVKQYEATVRVVGFEPENTSMRNVDFATTTAKYYESAHGYGTDSSNKLNKDLSEFVGMTFKSRCINWDWAGFFLCMHCTVSALDADKHKTTREFLCGLMGGGTE